MEIDNTTNPQVTLTYNQSFTKGQNSLMSKACLIAGVAFAIICGIAFLFSYIIQNVMTSYEQLNAALVIASVALIVSIVVSLVASFKKNLSWGLILTMFGLFTISFGITFGMFFAIYDVETLLLAFVTAAGALLGTGLIGYFIKDKAAFTLSKITMFLFLGYFIFMIVSLVMMYTIYQPNEWWYYALDVVIGLVIFGSNVMTFYALKRSSEFAAASDLPPEMLRKITWMLAFNVLISIVNTLLFVLRMFASR